jgi:hypothetical protein
MESKTLKFTLLWVVPLFFVIICLALISTKPPQFTVITDPEYFHLLTGLNIAQLKFISADYVHPCMPLQLLTGVIIKLVYFFAGQETDIVSDVFQRPEFYVSAINISFILIIASLFLIVGIIVFSLTGEVFAGIFLQTIVFVNSITLFQLTVSVPERLAFPFIALLICLLRFNASILCRSFGRCCWLLRNAKIHYASAGYSAFVCYPNLEGTINLCNFLSDHFCIIIYSDNQSS